MATMPTQDVRNMLPPRRGSTSEIVGSSEWKAWLVSQALTLLLEASVVASDTERGVGLVCFFPGDEDARGSLQSDNVAFGVRFWLSTGCRMDKECF